MGSGGETRTTTEYVDQPYKFPNARNNHDKRAGLQPERQQQPAAAGPEQKGLMQSAVEDEETSKLIG